MTSSFMPSTILPYIVHLYDSGWRGDQSAAVQATHFKKTYGILTEQPKIHYAHNSGVQPITLSLPAQDTSGTAPAIGDVMLLTEQDGDGGVIAGGLIEDVPEDLDITVNHRIELSSFVIELGETPMTGTNYTGATDPAQMVRDAVSQTKHLFYTGASVPLTAYTGKYDFSFTGTSLKILNIAKQIASGASGSTFYWYVDELGQVWFGSANAGGVPQYTVKRGQDYSVRKYKAPVDKLKNWIPVIGGTPPGQNPPAGQSPIPIATTYDAGTIRPGYPFIAPVTAPSTVYGTRARIPHMHFPKLLDQATLNNLAAAAGAQLNRRQTKITLELPMFGTRINLSVAAGCSLRYWDPDATAGLEETFVGAGAYSPNYFITDVELEGIKQTLTLTDIVTTEDDMMFHYDQMYGDLAMDTSQSVTITDTGIIMPPMLFPGIGAGTGPSVPTVPSLYNP